MESPTLISRNCVPLSDVTCSVNIPFGPSFATFSHVPALGSRDSTRRDAEKSSGKLFFSYPHDLVLPFLLSRKLIGRKLDVRLIIKWRNVRSLFPRFASRKIFVPTRLSRFHLVGGCFYRSCRGEFSSATRIILLRDRYNNQVRYTKPP